MEQRGLILEVSPDILEAVRLPPGEIKNELRKELALALYRRSLLSLGKARVLAGMNRWEFEELLGRRRVIRHYTETDLREDLQYGLGGK
ncbi:MAG: UPF0175 family protein [Deltaproteobacteria bacterium]|nr:MAG: UPF0175 family protein [Deltaproteobacteria bacterium]